jgi:hypothetical protein
MKLGDLLERPMVVAWMSAMLTGALAWVLFISNTGYSSTQVIAADTQKIAALQVDEEKQQREIEQLVSLIAAVQSQFVSQAQFREFEAAYDKHYDEQHAFQVRQDERGDASERELETARRELQDILAQHRLMMERQEKR